MKNLSIAIKYSIPTVILGVCLVIFVVMFSYINSQMENRAETFPRDFMTALNEVLNGDRDLYQARLAEVTIGNNRDGNIQSQIKDYQENAEQALARFNMFRSHMAAYPDVLQELSAFDGLYTEWQTSSKKTIQLRQSQGNQAALAHINSDSQAKFSALRELYNLAGELSFEKAKLLKESIRSQNANTKMTTWVIAVIAMVVVVILVVIGQKALLRRIHEVTDRIREISQGGGDLTKQIRITEKDEIGLLGKEFNSFLEMLRGLVIVISKDACTLSTTSKTLDQSADSTANIVEQQLTATDTIVHSVNEMSLATKELSEIAQKTADETSKAMDATAKGVDITERSVKQIESLFGSVQDASESAKALAAESTNISNVLDVIRGVAEQTNLLALNAAIEAARAGEQGRGFAVVADEVRALASKTQESTENIQNMIESLQSGVNGVVAKIEEGFDKATSSVELSKETRELLAGCNETVNTISAMSIQTAAATEEQSVVSDGINSSLQELNAQTQQTRAEANNTKTGATEISAMATSISNGVGKFSV
jgi:methyl-accepting chemotaxis protein